MRSNQLSYLAILFRNRNALFNKNCKLRFPEKRCKYSIIFLGFPFHNKKTSPIKRLVVEADANIYSILHEMQIRKMESRKKIQLEYLINCSPKILYNRLSTAAGLAEWFADDVHVRGKTYTFIWEKSEQKAEMSINRENKLVRYTWLDESDEDAYFEFRISQDELTGDVSLIVVDNPEIEEAEEIEHLWNTQIENLKHVLGS